MGVKVVSAVYHITLRKKSQNERFLGHCRTEKKSAVCSLLFLKPNFERPRDLVALMRSALKLYTVQCTGTLPHF